MVGQYPVSVVIEGLEKGRSKQWQKVHESRDSTYYINKPTSTTKIHLETSAAECPQASLGIQTAAGVGATKQVLTAILHSAASQDGGWDDCPRVDSPASTEFVKQQHWTSSQNQILANTIAGSTWLPACEHRVGFSRPELRVVGATSAGSFGA